ncbi:MAG: zinc-binding dehydrogenase [Myxococcota bacterium]
MSTCRAGVFNGDGTYQIQDFALPTALPGGGVLKVEAVGLCGSDVAQLAGHHHVPGEVAPIVPGHEIVGRVHALAADSTLVYPSGEAVREGDRVAVEIIVPAEPSPEFPHGFRAAYSYTLGTDNEHGLWGGYGEYMGLLPGTRLHKLTDAVSAAELTFFEGLASAVNWVDVACVKKGDTVVIQGPGHMGLACVVMAKIRGAAQVILSGTAADAERFEIARQIGADHTINVEEEDIVARVAELTGQRMAQVVMDMTAIATKPVQLCLELAGHGGHILIGGLKNEAPVEIISDHIIFRSLTIHGGSGASSESAAEACELLNAGRIPTAELLGTTCTLDELDHGIALLKREVPGQDVLRVVLTHSD